MVQSTPQVLPHATGESLSSASTGEAVPGSPVMTVHVRILVAAGRSVDAIARNAGAVAVANRAWVTVVSALVTVGAFPAPPPSTTRLALSTPDVAQVVAESKYGIPPLVPAITNAGVVAGVFTVIIPPVKL